MNSKGATGTRTLSIGWRILIFLISFLIVAYVYVSMRLWSGDFTTYFLRTQNWGMLGLMFMIIYIFSTVLTKILQWQFRIETKPLKKRRRKK